MASSIRSSASRTTCGRSRPASNAACRSGISTTSRWATSSKSTKSSRSPERCNVRGGRCEEEPPADSRLLPDSSLAMPRDYPRSRRIAEQIQRELSDIIRLELKDPRVGMITLTEVELSQDQSHAKVFFTTLGEESRVTDATEGLRHAAGFL